LITEGVTDETQSRRRRIEARTKYISQVMKEAEVASYRELQVMADERKKWRGSLL